MAKDYSELLRVVLKPTIRQRQRLHSDFCLRKNKSKYVITNIDTFRNRLKKEQQNIILMASCFTVLFNNTFAFFVEYHKHLESSKNILKQRNTSEK